MKITALTPTGDRPLALGLCKKWVENQTRKPDQWLIIDDGSKPYDPGGGDYRRRQPKSFDPKHTLNVNILFSLPYIKGDAVVVMEDDEYYSPDYIATMERYLDRYEVVGVGQARYYHIQSKGYSRHANVAHASLAQTSFQRSMLPTVEKCAQLIDKNYLDIRIWNSIGGRIEAGTPPPVWEKKIGKNGVVFGDNKNPLYVGIKGLPGRAGIGAGHKENHYKHTDPEMKILRQWIPKAEDFNVYAKL